MVRQIPWLSRRGRTSVCGLFCMAWMSSNAVGESNTERFVVIVGEFEKRVASGAGMQEAVRGLIQGASEFPLVETHRSTAASDQGAGASEDWAKGALKDLLRCVAEGIMEIRVCPDTETVRGAMQALLRLEEFVEKPGGFGNEIASLCLSRLVTSMCIERMVRHCEESEAILSVLLENAQIRQHRLPRLVESIFREEEVKFDPPIDVCAEDELWRSVFLRLRGQSDQGQMASSLGVGPALFESLASGESVDLDAFTSLSLNLDRVRLEPVIMYSLLSRYCEDRGIALGRVYAEMAVSGHRCDDIASYLKGRNATNDAVVLPNGCRSDARGSDLIDVSRMFGSGAHLTPVDEVVSFMGS